MCLARPIAKCLFYTFYCVVTLISSVNAENAIPESDMAEAFKAMHRINNEVVTSKSGEVHNGNGNLVNLARLRNEQIQFVGIEMVQVDTVISPNHMETRVARSQAVAASFTDDPELMFASCNEFRVEVINRTTANGDFIRKSEKESGQDLIRVEGSVIKDVLINPQLESAAGIVSVPEIDLKQRVFDTMRSDVGLTLTRETIAELVAGAVSTDRNVDTTNGASSGPPRF